MGRRTNRWAIWKIAVSAAACCAGAVVLFWLSIVMGAIGGPATDDPGQGRFLGLPTFILIMGVASSMLAILCVIWLVTRIREARIPPWERGKKSRRH